MCGRQSQGSKRARYDLTAAKKLFDAGTISNQQYDVYQKTVDQAEARYQASLENVRNLEGIIEEKRAALDLTKKQLADSDIISPLSGVVKEKTASRGEYLQPGKPVVTIVQINPLRLRLEVPETFAASIAKGQVVTLKVDSFADREFKGVIKRINPSMDEKSRSLIAEAEVANPNALLRPGMFARSQIVSNSGGGRDRPGTVPEPKRTRLVATRLSSNQGPSGRKNEGRQVALQIAEGQDFRFQSDAEHTGHEMAARPRSAPMRQDAFRQIPRGRECRAAQYRLRCCW